MNPVAIAVICAAVIVLGLATWKAPRLTSTLVWSFIAAFAICIAIATTAPGPALDRVSFFAVGTPVVWGCLQFWCYWHGGKWRVVGGLLGATAIGAAVAVLG